DALRHGIWQAAQEWRSPQLLDARRRCEITMTRKGGGCQRRWNETLRSNLEFSRRLQFWYVWQIQELQIFPFATVAAKGVAIWLGKTMGLRLSGHGELVALQLFGGCSIQC